MTCLKIIIPVLICMFCSLQCNAQNNDKYVYKDTSIQLEETPSKSIEEPNEETGIKEAKAETGYETEPDTTLRINHFVISADSIEALKKSKPFAYARNLDSLLKALDQETKKQPD